MLLYDLPAGGGVVTSTTLRGTLPRTDPLPLLVAVDDFSPAFPALLPLLVLAVVSVDAPHALVASAAGVPHASCPSLFLLLLFAAEEVGVEAGAGVGEDVARAPFALLSLVALGVGVEADFLLEESDATAAPVVALGFPSAESDFEASTRGACACAWAVLSED